MESVKAISFTDTNVFITLLPMLLLINIKVSIFIIVVPTETALTLIINDILVSLDKYPFYLALLDLSCDFDTLDHSILSIRRNEIGINGKVYSWCMSFV